MKPPPPGIDLHRDAHRLFGTESDRGAALVVAAMLETALEHLLSARLLPATSKEHDILSAPRAPLGTFSAKINAAQQLGLISRYLARDLHFVRKIRNEFAHHPLDLSFSDSPVVDWVKALEAASDYNRRDPDLRSAIGPPGPRWDFLGIASWILYSLQRELQGVEPCSAPTPEFGYIRWEDLPAEIQRLLNVSESDYSKPTDSPGEAS